MPLLFARDISLISGFLKSNSPELEFAFRLALFAPFLGKTFRLVRPKQTRIRKFPYLPLVIHILCAPAQFLRYYGSYIQTRNLPVPDRLDLLFSGLFSLTSFILICMRAQRHSNITRTVFQTTITQHGVPFILGYYWGDARLFGLSVRFMSLFSWFRVVHRVLPRLLPVRFKGPGKYVVTYDAAIVVGTFISLWEVGYPAGAGIFAGSVACLMWLERLLALRVANYPQTNFVRRILIATGIVDYEALTGKGPDAVTPDMWKETDSSKAKLQ
ncbi:uncharacterized protein RAG0_14638 [Rhynchosporium agropyri]|uniref:Uncharacterized protein n=1 Tax=Rhynchosporium agropyri TaxID=914238 RepID=A0A1E1LHQ2_9HELO|nr:uncharacterized protein RAG0_14638 [Rhynchosporium agropyri]